MNTKKLVTWMVCFALLFGLAHLSLTHTAIAAAGSDFEIVDGVLVAYSGKGGKVVIPDGVIEIGDGAFHNQRKVSSLVFPDGLKEIGNVAFDFTGIASLDLPDSLESIGGLAFYGCKKLTKVEFPQSLRSIGEAAFAESSVGIVSLPSGLEQIGTNAFSYNSKLKEFKVDEDNPHFTSRDGVLYTKDMETLVLYPPAKKGNSYSIPEGVKRIGAYAFDGAKQLGALALPAGLETINENAFASSGLKNIHLPASTKELGKSALFNCKSLKEIIVDEDNKDFVVADGALYTKDMQTLLAYPAAGKEKEFTVPEGVLTIGAGAFSGNQSLTYIFMRNSNIINIEEKAFYECKKIMRPGIPEGVEQISAWAFYGCKGMKSIYLPSTLKHIGDHAFQECTSLSEINSESTFFNFPEGLESIGSNTFLNTKVKDFTIPKSVTHIGLQPFNIKTTLIVYRNSYGHQYAQESGYSFGIIVEYN